MYENKNRSVSCCCFSLALLISFGSALASNVATQAKNIVFTMEMGLVFAVLLLVQALNVLHGCELRSLSS